MLLKMMVALVLLVIGWKFVQIWVSRKFLVHNIDYAIDDVDETYREVYHGEMCSCEIKELSPGTCCKSRVCAVSAGGMGPVRLTRATDVVLT